MPSTHTKKLPSKPVLARKSTRGPLEGEDDPLATSLTSSQLSPPSSVTSTLEHSTDLASETINLPEPSTKNVLPPVSRRTGRDLSFLLDTSIYHPLGQVDVPPAFRIPFPPPPRPDITIEEAFSELDKLLAQCHFLGAAHFSALVLTSSLISSTDHEAIFRLLGIRYSSLELSGNILLAAQEAKALEDLSSGFYYFEDLLPEKTAEPPAGGKPLPRHCMPFDLRLQAIRLQSIAFSDARRGVSALYDLGLECREYMSSPMTNEDEVTIWEQRLQDVGIRVVNALIETGDLDCARRTLDSMHFKDETRSKVLIARKILLALKLGDVSGVQHLSQHDLLSEPEKSILGSLLDVAAGRYSDAQRTLSDYADQHTDSELNVIVKQNLAIAYLYTGNLIQCRTILEELVDSHAGFQCLTTNLATVYELSSDHARDLKMSLTNRVAEKQTKIQHRAYVNADFKL